MDSDIYYAYVSSPSKKFPYSQRLQRLLIHDFAEKKGLKVTYYIAEIPAPGIFYNLEQKVLEGAKLKGFITFSMKILFPFDKGETFLKKVLDGGYEMWFAEEDQVVKSKDDIEKIWLLEGIKRISDENEDRANEFEEFCKSFLA
jgi:sporadic carbohydrate cluster protein (TIGR04323 family)